MTTERAILVHTVIASFIDGVRKSVKVEVYEICTGLNVADLRGFEVRTDTGYRAIFPEAHTECSRAVCVKHDNFTMPTREVGTHCHGFHHLEQVKALANRVARTYGGPGRGRTPRVAKVPAEWTPERFARLAEKVMADHPVAGPSWVTAEWLG